MIRPVRKPSEKIRIRAFVSNMNRRAAVIGAPGVVVVSGATGSGRSTTLDQFLRKKSPPRAEHI